MTFPRFQRGQDLGLRRDETIGRGNDGLVQRNFRNGGHLRTFQDIQARPAGLGEAWMSGFGADKLLIEVILVINYDVSSVALLDLSASDGTVSRTR